jgi:hypothetical protein
MANTGTHVHRSGNNQLKFRALAGSSAIIGLLAGYPIIGVIVGALVWFAAADQDYQGQCPHCDARLGQILPGIVGPCGSCRKYSEWNKKDLLLKPLADDARFPRAFAIPVEFVGGRWPPMCCGCGEGATRTETIRDLSAGMSVTVPCCDDCKQPAELAGAELLGEERTRVFALKVSSYRFYLSAMFGGLHYVPND